jgi:hypothetical protein
MSVAAGSLEKSIIGHCLIFLEMVLSVGEALISVEKGISNGRLSRQLKPNKNATNRIKIKMLILPS